MMAPSSYAIEIDPCINIQGLDQTTKILCDHGLDIQQFSGFGSVEIIRLLEGIYPSNEARRRLAVLKKTVDSAFVLPLEGKLGL